jgi:hypothetical protein
MAITNLCCMLLIRKLFNYQIASRKPVLVFCMSADLCTAFQQKFLPRKQIELVVLNFRIIRVEFPYHMCWISVLYVLNFRIVRVEWFRLKKTVGTIKMLTWLHHLLVNSRKNLWFLLCHQKTTVTWTRSSGGWCLFVFIAPDDNVVAIN